VETWQQPPDEKARLKRRPLSDLLARIVNLALRTWVKVLSWMAMNLK
jgi:hypothetical protein